MESEEGGPNLVRHLEQKSVSLMKDLVPSLRKGEQLVGDLCAGMFFAPIFCRTLPNH